MVTSNPIPEDPRLAPDAPASFVLHPRREDPAWDGWDIAGLFVVAVLALSLATLAAVAVARQVGGAHAAKFADSLKNARVAVPGEALGYAILVLFMVMIVRRRGARFWKAVKWNWPSFWAAYLFLGVGVAFVLQLFSAVLPMPKKMPIDEFFRDATSAYILAFFGVLVAPVIEELFFRGFLYPVLERAFERFTRAGIAVALAVIFTALPFALMHASQLAVAWGPLLVLFLVGVTLTLVRAETQSLAASVLTHAGYNLTLFVAIWHITDHFRNLDKLAR